MPIRSLDGYCVRRSRKLFGGVGSGASRHWPSCGRSSRAAVSATAVSRVIEVGDTFGLEIGLMLGLAAVSGARRAELAALRTLAVVEGERKERAEFGPWMFALGDDPPNPDRIGYWWRLAREKAGVDAKWRLHDLRHWSASVAIAAGHDVKTVADRLGHANAAMTLLDYAHAFAASDRAVADSVGALLESDE